MVRAHRRQHPDVGQEMGGQERRGEEQARGRQQGEEGQGAEHVEQVLELALGVAREAGGETGRVEERGEEDAGRTWARAG